MTTYQDDDAMKLAIDMAVTNVVTEDGITPVSLGILLKDMVDTMMVPGVFGSGTFLIDDGTANADGAFILDGDAT